MRVLFFGTPEFAAPSLMALVGEGFEGGGAGALEGARRARRARKGTGKLVGASAL